MAKVSVHLVTWNSLKVLPEALESLREQTFQDFNLIVVDNASTDGSVNCVRENFPTATVIRNFKNLGFARAHNQAIQMSRKASPEYVLVMNPDIILMENYLEKIVAAIDGRPEIGSIGGKLLKVYPRLEEYGEPQFSRTVDSVGLTIAKNRRVADRGSGEKDVGQFGEQEEVFGISGALALYRAEALDTAVLSDEEVFDDDFFAYKEDADLAWRLQLFGWKSAYTPTALAYHYRGAGGAENAGWIQTFCGRWSRSTNVNRFSSRNHLMMLVKNEQFVNGLLYGIFILPYELLKFLYVLFFSPKVLAAYLDFWKLFPKMLKKRREIMKRKKLSAGEMRKWFK